MDTKLIHTSTDIYLFIDESACDLFVHVLTNERRAEDKRRSVRDWTGSVITLMFGVVINDHSVVHQVDN